MIILNNLSKYYVHNSQVIAGIKEISATFKKGEFVIITGPSGSGKTTFLNILAGTDNYSNGEMIVGCNNTEYFGDEDWERYRKEYIGFVYQDYNLIENASIYDNVLMSYELNHDTDKETTHKCINEILEKVDMLASAKQKVSTLSGGQNNVWQLPGR
ncbi:MAG: ATP-binding cassette domain-containing protein [Christensenellaceae bacterium]|jgi:ABC-type lipoprotein export system ATPase subunit|nr:ATP-binding cassette domain-containing protein [Christensenellaceae bacterium]